MILVATEMFKMFALFALTFATLLLAFASLITLADTLATKTIAQIRTHQRKTL
jgi:hypothetical protein